MNAPAGRIVRRPRYRDQCWTADLRDQGARDAAGPCAAAGLDEAKRGSIYRALSPGSNDGRPSEKESRRLIGNPRVGGQQT